MADDTVTLALNGDVSLDGFAVAVQGLQQLVAALSREISSNVEIDWVVASLDTGSAIVTIQGDAQEEQAVESVVRAYEVVGEALERGGPIPYSGRVASAAQAIAGLLNGRITSIRFETPSRDIIIVSPMHHELERLEIRAYGAVEGRIQTLSNRRGLRFVLYDAMFDRAVSCYLQPNQEERVRDTWGRRAVVEGIVSRDAITGKPIAIRNITAIVLKEEQTRRWYRTARSASPLRLGDPFPEDAIRDFRDG